jgi:nicotinamidase-related amidase
MTRLTRAAQALLICVIAFALSACIKERLPLRGPLTALVLLDYQVDYLSPNGQMPVAQDQVDGMIKATNSMIAAMQRQPFPVIYTLNEFNPFEAWGDFSRNFAAMRYEAGSTLDKRINYVAGVYFAKGDWSAFANPQFDQHLQLIGAGHLVLAGTYAERTVLATAREAKRRGYGVTVISDAVASSDAQKRDAALQQLRQEGIAVETSDQFITSLGAVEKKG